MQEDGGGEARGYAAVGREIQRPGLDAHRGVYRPRILSGQQPQCILGPGDAVPDAGEGGTGITQAGRELLLRQGGIAAAPETGGLECVQGLQVLDQLRLQRQLLPGRQQVEVAAGDLADDGETHGVMGRPADFQRGLGQARLVEIGEDVEAVGGDETPVASGQGA